MPVKDMISGLLHNRLAIIPSAAKLDGIFSSMYRRARSVKRRRYAPERQPAGEEKWRGKYERIFCAPKWDSRNWETLSFVAGESRTRMKSFLLDAATAKTAANNRTVVATEGQENRNTSNSRRPNGVNLRIRTERKGLARVSAIASGGLQKSARIQPGSTRSQNRRNNRYKFCRPGLGTSICA